MAKSAWETFQGIRSQSFVRDMLSDAREVAPDELVVMRDYRLEERKAACGGHDPIRITLAYAQDELAYDDEDEIVSVEDRAAYGLLAREQKVNKFGLSYRRDAQFLQHHVLADIVVGAAIHLYKTQGWTTVLYDGLRTMEGAYKLYCFAPDSDITQGLLALPGQSAHNKGLAVDSMMMDSAGKEVPMGGHFDHLDMETNNRAYGGFTAEIRQNRILREAAFLRSAFMQGLLVAPLRSEFWDDRLPENREDLWRVLDSAARCVGITLLTPDDLALRKQDSEAFRKKWESWSYTDFLLHWRTTFKGYERRLKELFGAALPPIVEKVEFYHGNYHPIYDSRLRKSGKHLTD